MTSDLPEIDGFPSSALPGGGRRYEVTDINAIHAYPMSTPDLLDREYLVCVFREKSKVGRMFPARDTDALREVLEVWRNAREGKRWPREAPDGEKAIIRGDYRSPLGDAMRRASPWYRPERQTPTSWGLQILP